MTNYVLTSGDKAVFTFSSVIPSVLSQELKGSTNVLLDQAKVCVVEDAGEKILFIKCTYTTPNFTIPGQCTITIKALKEDHKSKTTTIESKQVLLQGGDFDAVLKVDMKAKSSPPPPATPTEDPMDEYNGTGKFVLKDSNRKWQSN